MTADKLRGTAYPGCRGGEDERVFVASVADNKHQGWVYSRRDSQTNETWSRQSADRNAAAQMPPGRTSRELVPWIMWRLNASADCLQVGSQLVVWFGMLAPPMAQKRNQICGNRSWHRHGNDTSDRASRLQQHGRLTFGTDALDQRWQASGGILDRHEGFADFAHVISLP